MYLLSAIIYAVFCNGVCLSYCLYDSYLIPDICSHRMVNKVPSLITMVRFPIIKPSCVFHPALYSIS